MDNTEYFRFLDNLRISGALDLFEGAVFLTEEFGLSRAEAKKVVAEWREVTNGRV
jgi:hypothetical protein